MKRKQMVQNSEIPTKAEGAAVPEWMGLIGISFFGCDRVELNPLHSSCNSVWCVLPALKI